MSITVLNKDSLVLASLKFSSSTYVERGTSFGHKRFKMGFSRVTAEQRDTNLETCSL